MTHRYFQFATATALACATAAALAAQTAPPRAEDGREVTAIGCLKQERDIHGRMTTGVAGEASRSGGGEAFVLMNARITSASMTDARPAAGDPAAPGGATAANPPERGPETMYKVVGLADSQLTPLLGKEVEVRARLDANTMGTAALRQPGVTMGREPASTPSASTPPPEPTQAPPSQSDRQTDRQDMTPPASASLPQLKAASIKATGGRCQGT